MMSRLQLTFFGSPHISLDGSPLTSRVDKSIALIALLALQGPALHRDLLITTLWTNSSLSKAQAALRIALWRLKDAGLGPWLDIQRDLITLHKDENIRIDVDQFRANLEKARQAPHDQSTSCPECAAWLEGAVNLYRGDFMAGYSPRNASGFDEWRAQLSQQLRDELFIALERLVRGYHEHGLYDKAVHFARHWLAVDPFNEEAHLLIMRSYAHNDQRANAIAHYRAYNRQVAKQLETSPSKEITALYQHLLKGNNPPAVSSPPLKEPVFLMLDIHHFPDLWAKHGVVMETVLDRFTNVVKEGLLKCGGRLVKSEADGFLLYFDPGRRLECASAVPRLNSPIQWGLPDPWAISMAITTVSNHPSTRSEYTPELVSCRALLSAAAGNQILLTEQAARTLELPISSRVKNLGSYFLPGQNNPMQVYELVHPALPTPELNGLHSLVRSPANLPIQATRFVGRETELKQLHHLLTQPECHLLTLVGPGGVGKTRLAIQVISQLEHTQSDGIIYVPLAGHHEPESVYRPLAEALHLPLNDPHDKAAQLIHYLSSKCMFLLLDNFEHLLDSTPFILNLLENAPGLRIIITSRERLKLRMEIPFEVRGLSYPDNPHVPDFDGHSGIQLFIQNAQRVFPSFVLRPEDKASIIQICHQVDGLPLGIELASTWVRALTCQEIAAAIQRNIEFPLSTSQDVPPRHRSLRAAFEHSWNLLSEEDRRILARLSIFNNGFFPQAAEHIANASPVLLASYVDKSMLTRQSNGRYVMLEVLRVYALEHIQSNALEYENLLDRYCAYYLHLLSNSFNAFAGENAAAEIRKLWLDANNIRFAVNLAMDHHHWSLLLDSLDPLMAVFEMQGRFREGYDNAILIINRVDELVGMQQPDIYYSLLGWQGVFGFRLGHSEEGLRQMQARLDYMQNQSDLIPNANFYTMIADAHRRHGDMKNALAEINQSLEILEPYSSSNDPLLSSFYANALYILGGIQLKLNQLEAARQTALRCGAMLSRSKSQYVRMRLLDLQARIANEDQQSQTSIDLRLQALVIAEEFDDRRSIAILLNNMGDSAERMEDYPSAITHLSRAAQISEEIGDLQISAVFNNNLGFMNTLMGNASQAIQYYQKSLRLYVAVKNRNGYFLTLRDASRAYLLAGNVETARAQLIEAIHLGIDLADPLRVLQLLPATARLFLTLGYPARAAQLCQAVLNHPQSDPDLQRTSKTLLAGIAAGADLPAAPLPAGAEPILPTFESLLSELTASTPVLIP